MRGPSDTYDGEEFLGSVLWSCKFRKKSKHCNCKQFFQLKSVYVSYTYQTKSELLDFSINFNKICDLVFESFVQKISFAFLLVDYYTTLGLSCYYHQFNF